MTDPGVAGVRHRCLNCGEVFDLDRYTDGPHQETGPCFGRLLNSENVEVISAKGLASATKVSLKEIAKITGIPLKRLESNGPV